MTKLIAMSTRVIAGSCVGLGRSVQPVQQRNSAASSLQNVAIQLLSESLETVRMICVHS